MTTDEKLDLLITKVTGIESRMGGMESRMGGMETRMDGMETRMGGMETRMGGMETRMNGTEESIVSLNRKVDDFHAEMAKEIKDLKSMDKFIASEIVRVHDILDRHKENKFVHLT